MSLETNVYNNFLTKHQTVLRSNVKYRRKDEIQSNLRMINQTWQRKRICQLRE